MASTKATLGSGARLADYLCASLLVRVFPAERVHEALDAHGVNAQRIRRFPAAAGGKRAGNTPRELEAYQRDAPGCQRCGGKSSICSAGCVGSRVSTSLM